MNELEKKVQELNDALQKLADIEAKVNNINDAEMKSQLENLSTSIAKLQEDIKGLAVESKQSENFMENLEKLFMSAEFKNEVKQAIASKGTSKTFEVKIDTSNATTPVTRTNSAVGIFAAQPYENLFLAASGTPFIIGQDKNPAMWYEGAYTSNVGYQTEITASSTADAATFTEKYREMAKIAAFVPFSKEIAEDMSYFLNWARTKGIQYLLSKVDELIFAGAGNDSTAVKEIYGIKTQGSTAFNATTAGLATAIPSANIADLIRACITQVKIGGNGLYTPNAVFVHPSTLAILYALKNTQANYINVMPDGSMTIYGLRVYETTKIGTTEILVSDTRTWQMHQKQTLENELARVAASDSYVMYMRWRGNFVVPTNNKLGNIYVANTATAITAITKA